ISENSTWALKRRYGMVDPRIEKLAKVLVHYSLRIRRNDLFRITGPSLATPLVRAVYAEALAAGANPYVRVSLEGLEELFYRKATDEQLRFVSDLDREEIEQVDATLGMGGRAAVGAGAGARRRHPRAVRDAGVPWTGRRSHRLGRRPDLDQRRGGEELSRRRGVHRAGRGFGQRPGAVLVPGDLPEP